MACYEDDGYDDTDAIEIVANLKHHIDQGTAFMMHEAMGYGRSTGQTPVSQEVHDAVLASPQQFWTEETEVIIQKEKAAASSKLKILSAEEIRKASKIPYSIIEDTVRVEQMCQLIEAVDVVKILRDTKSIVRMAGKIRSRQHTFLRYKNEITCEEVRDILREFID